MKGTILGIAVALWASSDVLAGTVSFDPVSVTATQGELVEFTVSISATEMVDFDAIDLLLSSDVEGLNLAFTYDASFDPSFPAATPRAFGLFASDVIAGGFRAERWRAPLVIGRLQVDTSGLTPGTYTDLVGARPQRELEATLTVLSKVTLGLATEELSGAAQIVIVDPDADGGIGSTGGGDGGADSDSDTNSDSDTDDVADGMVDDSDGDDVAAGTGDSTDLDSDGDEMADAGASAPLAENGDTADDDNVDDIASDESAAPVVFPTCGGGLGAILLLSVTGLVALRWRNRVRCL